VEHFVERLNIEHFERLLKSETDPVKRAMLLKLLTEEEAKQAACGKPKQSHPR
jgi:hypothetical protein